MKTKSDKTPTLGITALIPPELVYSCGWKSLDLNNLVLALDRAPTRRLCAWTASWRDIVLNRHAGIDALAVVAGGDCYNALADGQAASNGMPSHYFFYQFDGDTSLMCDQMGKLVEFLGGMKCENAWNSVSDIKSKLHKIESGVFEGRIDAAAAFELLISGADMSSDIDGFRNRINTPLPAPGSAGPRVAMLGVPPIQRDFHRAASESGLNIVFDELPHEFLRLGGKNMDELSKSYATYTFARPLSYRLELLNRTLDGLNLDGAIHYTQYACHHVLEDDTLRREIDLPILTVQGDSPGSTSAGIRLRLEAFSEILGGLP